MVNYNQSISASYLQAPDDGDQVLFLYTQLMNLPFVKQDAVIQIERSLYEEYNAAPQDKLAVIALMQAQIMQGNHDKAKAFAYKLWDMGQNLSRAEKFLYINSLLNLGLLEMASILLKPHLENLTADIKKYFPVMLKFATMSGNTYLLERIIKHPDVPYDETAYANILQRYKNYKYVEHFKNVQKTIHEEIKDRLCVYDYDIVSTITEEIEIYLYLSVDKGEIEEVANGLRNKLQQYYQKVGLEKLSNFNWTILPITEHEAMGLN